LHTPVRILLVAASLHEADRRRYDEFAATGLLITGGERSRAQKIKLVLVETSLEPEQQTIIAVPGLDRLLINEDCVHDAAHLDRLLPIPAVAGKARDLAGADCADLAETDLGHHSLEANALHATGRRAAEILSTTSISVNPSAINRSRIAYCSAPLSRLCRTWWAADWRT
jgi:hypothetical protein